MRGVPSLPCGGRRACRDSAAGIARPSSVRTNGDVAADPDCADASHIAQHSQVPPGGGDPVQTEKPPFTDGCFFASLFEGPTSFAIGKVDRTGPDTWRVGVRFRNDPGAYEWDDAVVVRREASRFVIDDVLLGGAGEFNPSGSLRQMLAARE